MRAQLVAVALLLAGCTGVTAVHGPYASELSRRDVHAIRRLAARSPHFGHTVITLQAVRRDRVRVEVREYQESGWSSTAQYIVRDRGSWRIDAQSPPEFVTERRVVTD